MLGEYSHTSLAQVCAIIAEIQNFSSGLFFTGTPCNVPLTGVVLYLMQWIVTMCRSNSQPTTRSLPTSF